MQRQITLETCKRFMRMFKSKPCRIGIHPIYQPISFNRKTGRTYSKPVYDVLCVNGQIIARIKGPSMFNTQQ